MSKYKDQFDEIGTTDSDFPKMRPLDPLAGSDLRVDPRNDAWTRLCNCHRSLTAS